MNTDQGSQFTGSAWITTLTEAEVKISMDGRGRYLDNIFIERLWRSLTQEAVYLHELVGPLQLACLTSPQRYWLQAVNPATEQFVQQSRRDPLVEKVTQRVQQFVQMR